MEWIFGERQFHPFSRLLELFHFEEIEGQQTEVRSTLTAAVFLLEFHLQMVVVLGEEEIF